MQEVISMRSAKATLSQLIKRAVAGEPVYIGERGRALVKLFSADAAERPRKRFGLLKGKLVLPADLETPHPEHVTRAFEGEE